MVSEALADRPGQPNPNGRHDVIAAFDRIAEGYDEDFGRNPVGLLFRHVVQERLRRLFPPGSHVLDLGCGTGEDALFLAGAGVRVHALDVAPRMVQRVRAKAAQRGIPEARLRVETRAMEDVGGAGSGFDGAYSNFGALNCADLSAVGRGLASVLRPGAGVLLSLMGRWPLPSILERATTGRGEARGRGEPRLAGIPVHVTYPRPSEARERMGPQFVWDRGFALGVLVPGPQHAAWAWRSPQAFGLLAALEGVMRGWPLIRALGDYVVFEGRRR